ncbi:efflux RND transporter periplasmic adaptor subunit [Aquimarina brevivitae]|uniref:Cu(I)/Ag(I) efflux system membrane fusion protein n=1 Tax=Aquimarina brevivitae TaxID=323412 RepID=A0A4Q7PGY1_9FLAO|nr:efflux RND transporter periplasmic adaptor subunit [Aquimarina brevivitae]RZS99801.1 Cu(I)/Ag(I) efflux system membrane fusion protein [Aquimarina brevivitae]
MKKSIIFAVVAGAIGVLVGYLIFGNSNKEQSTDHQHTSATSNQMWTCSMHPQIMQPEPGDCPICGMELIPAETGADGLSKDQFTMTKNAIALANIQTVTIGSGNVNEQRITLSGKIVENEQLTVTQTVHYAGRIEKLYVNFPGEKVQKGQVIAELYAPKLVAAQQELLTAVALKSAQPELYNAVRNKLAYWKLSENQIKEIETSGVIKNTMKIYAENTGTVDKVMANVGDYVNSGAPLFSSTNLSSVWASFDAYESMLPFLSINQDIGITTNAYPNKKITATIDFIDPVLNTKTRTYTVRATLNNKNNELKPGMFVKGIVQTQNNKANQLITVPKTAVLWTGERSVVYLKVGKDRPVFELREVTLGKPYDESYEVVSGLENGDEVVYQGAFTVDASAQLQGKNSMMNSNKPAHMDKPEQSITVQGITSNNLESVLTSYLKLKNALIKSDVPKATLFGKETASLLKELKNQTTLSKSENQAIQDILNSLANLTSTEDIKNQRNSFRLVSDILIQIASNGDDIQKELYVQYCPMANNNKGAYWLSDSKEILNPYFGEMMLNCGDVTRSLQ